MDRVRPAVEGLLATELRHDMNALARQAVRANIRASVDHLRHGSEILEQLIEHEGLLVVGAEYSLETGVVEFLDELPAARLTVLRTTRPPRLAIPTAGPPFVNPPRFQKAPASRIIPRGPIRTTPQSG